MGQILRYLGLTVGVIQHDMPPPARRAAYACDVTYGTNNEFDFDYLRDNMAVRQEDQVTVARHHHGIVDEVDSVLVDEARTPLIISGPVQSIQQYDAIKPAVERVTREQTKLVNSILSEVEKLAVATETGGMRTRGTGKTRRTGTARRRPRRARQGGKRAAPRARRGYEARQARRGRPRLGDRRQAPHRAARCVCV